MRHEGNQSAGRVIRNPICRHFSLLNQCKNKSFTIRKICRNFENAFRHSEQTCRRFFFHVRHQTQQQSLRTGKEKECVKKKVYATHKDPYKHTTTLLTPLSHKYYVRTIEFKTTTVRAGRSSWITKSICSNLYTQFFGVILFFFLCCVCMCENVFV